MKMNDIERGLMQAFEAMEIIDCHEHLGPEANRVATPVDVFTLFRHYTRGALVVAGLTQALYDSLFDQKMPIENRWALFAPYWEQIRWGSYARAALLAAKRFYGFDDINESTYIPLTEAIQKNNTPGLYERVLKDACNIRTALTQCGSTELGGTPLLTPVMPLNYGPTNLEELLHPKFEPNASIRTIDDYLDAAKRYVVRVKGEGAPGLKLISNPFEPANRVEAIAAFNGLVAGGPALPHNNPLRDYVVDEIIRFATDQDMVICVHTGYWGDFRTLDPLHMLPLIIKHTKARFDIYHLGYPWMREAIMLGKGFANVWLNLCWTHIISQRFVQVALDELIDTVPMNKILAFGGDYGLPVEKVYGHLVMAREDIARILARRIDDGQMTEAQALKIAHQWLWNNPNTLYRLNL